MAIIRKHGGARAQCADRYDEISEGQDFARSIELPRQIFCCPPDTMVRSNVDKQIEVRGQMRFRPWPNETAKNFAADHTADHDLCDIERAR